MNPLFLPRLKDFLSGLFFCGAGIFTIMAAARHPLGNAMRMGTGSFPLLLGLLLFALGTLVSTRAALKHLRQGHALRDFLPATRFLTLKHLFQRNALKNALLPAALVGLGIVAFAGLLSSLGLALAILALVVISGAAHHEARLVELLVLGVGLSAFGAGVFVWGLGLPLPLLPA
ncbi:MAG: tripartite tricarboxylate transporter TctB family protein [Zoogloeaceae bacterium]|jgi:hypothetical protein|nr:tripartite tricarboxylate transporter TctB family protein [Zoogloeaceae bacterium]